MDLVRELSGFVVGLLAGFLIFSLICVSLFYQLPRAVYWWVRGWVRGLPGLAANFLPWLPGVAFALIWFGVAKLLPAVAAYMQESYGFWVGLYGTILFLTLRAILWPYMRRRMTADFLDLLTSQFTQLTDTGRQQADIIRGKLPGRT